jgi:hypothetical protein
MPRMRAPKQLRKDVVAIVRQFHVGYPGEEHMAKLFIGHVPENIGEHEIKETLDAAGYRFEEFGVKWANHCIVRLPAADPSVKNAWRNLQRFAEVGHNESDEYVLWGALTKRTDESEVLFLRVPSRLKDALAQKAEAEKVSLNEYCARALASAAQ